VELNRMRILIADLNEAANEYYNKNNEIMTNAKYDSLYDELVSLEEKFGIVYSNSPTQRVGAELVGSLKKVKHESKMLSLDKTKDINILNSFLGENLGLLSWKIDGLTCVISYENGELVSAVTRGDGEIGEDITHNALTFINLPKKIQEKGRLVLRGEAVISYENFEKINNSITDADEKYKNPRNLCSGSVRQLDSSICAARNVEWICFEVLSIENELDYVFKHAQLEYMKELGFTVVSTYVVKDFFLEEAVMSFTEESKKYKYPVDGLVLTLDGIRESKSKGSTSHHPLHSMAFKWADESQQTTLRDILVDVGKSGQISYTAVFDPVEIEGTTVEKATLHNYDNIQSLEIGIGDAISIIKANMIIPQVTDNETRSGTYKKAISCPSCGSVLEHNGVHQFCLNYDCEKQVVARLSHWCSRDAMNIEGMSEETIKAVREIKSNSNRSVLETVSDIYDLPSNKEALMCLDRFGKKKVDNLCAAIEKSKTMPLNNVIYGFAIPQVGRTASKKLANNFGNMDAIVGDIHTDFEIMNLVGNSVGASFIDNFLNNDKTEELITLLKSHGLTMVEEKEVSSDNLKGLSFVITGSLIQFKNRDELVAKIESMGGKVSGSVSKNTDYLINNDKLSTSGKNKKAMELNVKIISEEDFLQLTM